MRRCSPAEVVTVRPGVSPRSRTTRKKGARGLSCFARAESHECPVMLLQSRQRNPRVSTRPPRKFWRTCSEESFVSVMVVAQIAQRVSIMTRLMLKLHFYLVSCEPNTKSKAQNCLGPHQRQHEGEPARNLTRL